jgi:CRP/FNR family transcriptional regulator, anaerobic regulatory protein
MPEHSKDLSAKTDAFFSGFALKEYAKDEVLILGGDNPAGIFYLVDGMVAQYHITSSGQKMNLNIYKPHTFFPMAWAMNKNENKYFFEAVKHSTVRIAPPQKTLDFLLKNPDVLLDLTSRLYRGMDGLLDRIVELMAGNAQTRLIIELIIEMRRFGDRKAIKNNKITISTVELALRTGLSRETVSRELKKMEDEGLISRNKKTLTIIDITKLENSLEH